MRRNIIVLGALLALQVTFAAGLMLSGADFGARAPGTPLLTFDRAAVERLRVADGDGKQVELVRTDDGWMLPAHYDFPAADGKVKRLLDGLEGLAPRLPLATSDGAADRFRVSDAAYERRIDLLNANGDPVARLYVGDSSGYRRAYVRADGSDSVFEAEFDRASLEVEASDWVDGMALKRDASDLNRIEAGNVVLVRDGGSGEWTVEGLEDGVTVDAEAARDLVRDLALVRFDEVIGRMDGNEKPAGNATVVTLTADGAGPIEYRLVPDGDDAYTLTVSDKPWRFRLTRFQADSLTGISRDKLVAESSPESEGNKVNAKTAPSG